MPSRALTGLPRFTRHEPPVSAATATATALLITAAWALAGRGVGITATVLAAALLLVPVAGRTGYEWARLYGRHRRSEYKGEAALPSSEQDAANPEVERARSELNPEAFAQWEHRRRDAAFRHQVEEGYAWTSTVASDRTGGGVRWQDGTAITAIHVLGHYLAPTLMTGDTSVTDNVLYTRDLEPVLRQFFGLSIGPVSVVTMGTRVRPVGDYARAHHSMIGPPPYAGKRDMWLVLRVNSDQENVDSLALRPTVGKAALAATQRVVNTLRTKGIRAKVGTETDLADLDTALGGAHALQRHNRRWQAVRSDEGWMTSFYYPPEHINGADLAGIWSHQADLVIQNLTMYPDGRCSAFVTIRDPQIVTLPPTVSLSTLPGEQAAALAASRPRPAEVVGSAVAVAAGPPNLALPVRDSGVLIGRLEDGRRLAMPFTDPDTQLRIHIGADDHLAKRLIMRAAAEGERVTIHTRDHERWKAMAMPGIIVTDDIKPAAGTTISVTDSMAKPSPAPATVISLVGSEANAHMTCQQIGPAELLVKIPDPTYDPNVAPADQPKPRNREWRVEVDLFDDENPYLYVATRGTERQTNARHHAPDDPNPTTRTAVLPRADVPTTTTTVLPRADDATDSSTQTTILPQAPRHWAEQIEKHRKSNGHQEH